MIDVKVIIAAATILAAALPSSGVASATRDLVTATGPFQVSHVGGSVAPVREPGAAAPGPCWAGAPEPGLDCDPSIHGQSPITIAATIGVRCKNTIYTVSNGSVEGVCSRSESGGNIDGAACEDSDGNSSSVWCGFNDGQGGCKDSIKKGSCVIIEVIPSVPQ